MLLSLDPYFPLRSGRMHEVFGPGAWGFAAMLAAQLSGPLLWLRLAHGKEIVNPAGLSTFINPSRILTGQVKGQADGLAVAEEALRDGATPLVVIEITDPLTLTSGRRLQLAAKTGGTLCLCIIPEGAGSNAAETRWQVTPVLDPQTEDSTLQHWELKKNKLGTLRAWYVRWDHAARRLHVVSPPGQRPGAAPAPC
ncbi:MAG: hypothetical protein AAF330_00890 [Pseudomonadota bacterium]